MLASQGLGITTHRIRNPVYGCGSQVVGRQRPLPYRLLTHIICGSGGLLQVTRDKKRPRYRYSNEVVWCLIVIVIFIIIPLTIIVSISSFRNCFIMICISWIFSRQTFWLVFIFVSLVIFYSLCCIT